MIDCCLDTCVLIDLIKRVSAAEVAISRFNEPSVSHVVLGELLLGTMKSSQAQVETQKVLTALHGMTILHADP